MYFILTGCHSMTLVSTFLFLPRGFITFSDTRRELELTVNAERKISDKLLQSERRMGKTPFSSDRRISSLPNDNFLELTKFKAFADDNSNVAKMVIFVCDRVENIVGKGENAGYQHFLLFPQCLQKASFPGSLKIGIVW